jgi:hypothetical protein
LSAPVLDPCPVRTLYRPVQDGARTGPTGTGYRTSADLAVENPLEVGLAFAALQAKFGLTAAAARQLSSQPLGGLASFDRRFAIEKAKLCAIISRKEGESE